MLLALGDITTASFISVEKVSRTKEYSKRHACNVSAMSLTSFRLRWQGKSARDFAEIERAKQITHSDGAGFRCSI